MESLVWRLTEYWWCCNCNKPDHMSALVRFNTNCLLLVFFFFSGHDLLLFWKWTLQLGWPLTSSTSISPFTATALHCSNTHIDDWLFLKNQPVWKIAVLFQQTHRNWKMWNIPLLDSSLPCTGLLQKFQISHLFARPWTASFVQKFLNVVKFCQNASTFMWRAKK